MKLTWVFIILLLAVIYTQVPQTVIGCSPDAGYIICYSDSINYGNAKALTKIQQSDITGSDGAKGKYGLINGGYREYYIGEASLNVAHIGDRLYSVRGAKSWISCNFDYCNGNRVSDGKHVIATAPSGKPPNIQFTAWDFDGDAWNGGYRAYAMSQTGWVNTINPVLEFYVIGCYSNDDVGTYQFCNKTGTWDTWQPEDYPVPTGSISFQNLTYTDTNPVLDVRTNVDADIVLIMSGIRKIIPTGATNSSFTIPVPENGISGTWVATLQSKKLGPYPAGTLAVASTNVVRSTELIVPVNPVEPPAPDTPTLPFTNFVSSIAIILIAYGVRLRGDLK